MKLDTLKIVIPVFLIMSLILYSCDKDNDEIVNTSVMSTGLDGQWQFTITPLNDYIDTTTVKGKNGNDFISDPSINDEIYLYESSSQVLGFTGPFELRGSMTDSIRLEIFEPVDGRYGQDTSMIKSSEMTLSQNSMGHLEGTGKITLDHDTTGVSNDTYKIYGIKIASISSEELKNLRFALKSNWLDQLCDAAFSGIAFLTGVLTDNVFRPMGHCWGEKNGGGFYVFGHEGPGSILPVVTQTAYFPMEFSFCKVRRYHYDIKYNKVIWQLSALKNSLLGQLYFLDKLGWDFLALEPQLDDFYQTYGNFAITLAYDPQTHNGAFYINVENGSTTAGQHELIVHSKAAITHLFHELYIYSGRDISDEWHLKRSDFFVCNTPLTFFYCFGTASVIYD